MSFFLDFCKNVLLVCSLCSVSVYADEQAEAVFRAVEVGDFEALREYLERGESPDTANSAGFSLLMTAAVQGHLSLVDLLIRRGANANQNNLRGDTAILLASMAGRFSVVQYLLRVGADPLVVNINGYDALTLAMRGAHGVVEDLLVAELAERQLANLAFVRLGPSRWHSRYPIAVRHGRKD